MNDTLILAIESSCDETAVAILKNETELLSNVVYSQIKTHQEFGGVIPEVASRIHVEKITYVIKQALTEANVVMEDIDAIGITFGPGLIGSLHVGLQAAKTLAWMYNLPADPCPSHCWTHLCECLCSNIKVSSVSNCCFRWTQ